MHQTVETLDNITFGMRYMVNNGTVFLLVNASHSYETTVNKNQLLFHSKEKKNIKMKEKRNLLKLLDAFFELLIYLLEVIK